MTIFASVWYNVSMVIGRAARRGQGYDDLLALINRTNERLKAVHREDFAFLRGRLISIPDAAKRYGIPAPTLRAWLRRGYLTRQHAPNGAGVGILLDEAEVAFLATLHRIRREVGTRGKLLDEAGRPHLITEPEIAAARRARRRARE